MKTISKWVKNAYVKLVDPEREERVNSLVLAIRKALKAGTRQFSLSKTVAGIEHTPNDLELAKERVYRRLLTKLWKDEQLTDREKQFNAFVISRLEISRATANAINLGLAQECFGAALAEAMDDGVLEPAEEARLHQIASSVGSTVPDFVQSFFLAEGESFLRGVFLACIDDNHISQDEWDNLLHTTRKLGIAQSEMLEAIQPQARQFVEHVLADAKADGRLSAQEDETLQWLLSNLRLAPQFGQYVKQQVSLLRLLTEIQDGRLPSISHPSGVEIRSGEIVHCSSPAVWRHLRILKSGRHVDEHVGTLTLTDNRLIFCSPTKSQTLKYRRIVSHQGGLDRIAVQVDGKPINSYLLNELSPIPYAVFESAIAMANQTKVVNTEGLPSRHIPREVRQRVWQKYGGRCAECAASDYLEFDHIIPFAKGGSNFDSNIQLLCRRCNLKKSDHI